MLPNETNETSDEDAKPVTNAIPSEIEDLLRSRTTYMHWLDRLDRVADEARAEVVERVQADYQQRLEEVRSQLGQHRDELAERLDRRSARVAELEGDREEHLASREEAEIRHTVGEYDDEEWRSRREELDQTLDELERQLEEERTAISELQTALDAVDEPPGSLEELGLAETSQREAARSSAGTGDREESGREERPALQLVEEGEPEAPAGDETETPAEEEESGTGAPEDGSDGAYDELEFLESLSLEDADQFDAVDAMLDAEDEESGKEETRNGGEEGEADGEAGPSSRGGSG